MNNSNPVFFDRYNEIIANTPFLSLIGTDIDGKIIYFNKGAEDLLGYTVDEILHKETPLLFHDKDELNLYALKLSNELGKNIEGFNLFLELASKKGYYEANWYYVKKNGQKISVRLRVTQVRDESGELTGLLGIASDITDLLEIKKEKDAIYYTFENTSESILWLDKQGNIKLVNNAASQTIGFSKNHLSKMHIKDIDVNYDAYEWELFWDSIKLENNIKLNSIFKKNNGLEFPVAISMNYFIYKNSEYICAFITDITELQKLEKKFKAVIDSAPFGIHLFKIMGDKLIFAGFNKAANDMLNIEHSNLLRKEISEAFPHLINTELSEVFKNIALNGNRWQNENIDITVNEINFIFEVFAFQTEPGAMAVFFNDVTLKKKTEKERNNLIEELESKNSELERFTYTVSHDLRSPLITIKGFTGLLKQDLINGKTDRAVSFTDRVNNAAVTMQNLLDDLLELSRIGRIINPTEQIDTHKIVTNVVEVLTSQIEAKKIQIIINENLPLVYADKQRLYEVFQNLTENAVKFIGDDNNNPYIEFGGKKIGNFAELYVKDNGIGIDAQYHEKIFSLFDKLDKNTEGTGVGLALVKRIIEFHGGNIRVVSDGMNNGTTFYFTLPDNNKE